jgi:hypothetical protein
MKNYSDTISLPGLGISCEVNEGQPVLDPVRFLKLEKKEILYKLTSEFGYSEEEALKQFNSMIDIIERLKPLRCSQSETDDSLKDTINSLRRGSKMLIIMHLLKATERDDSYFYAYNTLVYYVNRYGRLNLPRKNIHEADLLIKIEGENRPSLPVSADPSNPFVFEKTLLNAFYLAFDNYIWEHAGHKDFMNWFRVKPVGKPVFKNKMTTYFCYAIRKIEHRIIESRKPVNINHWIRPLINGNNYSLMKSRAADREKMADIDDKLSLF